MSTPLKQAVENTSLRDSKPSVETEFGSKLIQALSEYTKNFPTRASRGVSALPVDSESSL